MSSFYYITILHMIRVTTIKFPSAAQSFELAEGSVLADVIAQGNFGDNVQLEHNGKVLQFDDVLTNGMVIKVVETDNSGIQVVKKIAGANDEEFDDEDSEEETQEEFTDIDGLIVVTLEQKVVHDLGKFKSQIADTSSVASLLKDAGVSLRGVEVRVNGSAIASLGTKLNNGDVVEVINK